MMVILITIKLKRYNKDSINVEIILKELWNAISGDREAVNADSEGIRWKGPNLMAIIQ